MNVGSSAAPADQPLHLARPSTPSLLGPLFKLAKDPFALVCLVVLLLVVLCASLSPLIAPYDPNEIDPFHARSSPSKSHPLGTDENGRDVLSRVVYGSRISLSVGVISVGIAILAGVPLGLASGYFGGFLDTLIMRLMDALLAFPAILLALAMVAILGSGLIQLMVAVGVTSIPVYSRIVRAQVLSLKRQDFVIAATAMGAPVPRILFRHILPNTIAPIIVQASLGMAFAILAEASLSFLGVGIKPPTASWGGMLQKAVPLIRIAPYLSLFPGLAIFLATLSLNVLGDALRDQLDPRLRGTLERS